MNRLFLVGLLLLVVTEVLASSCPAGYYRRPGGNCYKLWTQKRKWGEANVICRTENSWLVTLNNEVESDWVNNFFISNRRHECNKWYWIGLNDISNEDVWTWISDNSPLHYSNWKNNEPNNSGNEDSVEVDCENRQWNDEDSWGNEECFICEMDTEATC
ncbi:perlucin-like protein [Acanthaster planci]|uniref:Perlucin-like protein n=1 Tax=Acanthaster planci TaxID=133434 RepID=A0A8B7YBK5_ACAPL|nr:perlucin-like protein [Acanthaster planci]